VLVHAIVVVRIESIAKSGTHRSETIPGKRKIPILVLRPRLV